MTSTTRTKRPAHDTRKPDGGRLDRGHGAGKMPHFARGVVQFQNHVYPQKRELFERLSKGQNPEALFITCSDSRIETAMITQTDPGELFICRNAGNIVPPHTSHTGGMTASIEYAVSALEVQHIVICGHTECGAMIGALDLDSLGKMPHVREWLSYARAAVEVVDTKYPDATPEQRLNLLLRQNVVLQLQHLCTHPAVAARLAKGDLHLHGWVYDIATGEVDAYNDATDDFESVEVHYAGPNGELACGCCH